MTGEELLVQLRPLIDSRCGVLSGVVPMSTPAAHESGLYAFAAPTGNVSTLHPEVCSVPDDASEMWGYGTAADSITAQVRAVCEGIERYCAVMYPRDGVHTASARQLGSSALDPRRLPQCSARERERTGHRLRTPDPDHVDRWVRGYSVTRGEPVWVPISAVYLGLPIPLHEHLVFPESTGFATGASYRAAILAGLCEVIERDSVALWWLHQLPMPRLDVAALDDSVTSDLHRRARRIGIEARLIDLTTDTKVPVVALIQTSTTVNPHVVLTAACRVDVAAAARRAFEEAGSVRIALSATSNASTDVHTGDPASPRGFGAFYAGPDGPDRFRFVEDGPLSKTPPPSIAGPDVLDAIVTQLAAIDAEVIAVDITQPEIRELGLVVVRVIVPELMRISFSHHIRYLGHPRLYAAAARLGYGNRTEDEITDDPHPFA